MYLLDTNVVSELRKCRTGKVTEPLGGSSGSDLK